MSKSRQKNRIRRHKRVRAKITGTAARPRLSVFRSSKHMSLQLIDDVSGKTLAAASTAEVKDVKGKQLRAAAAAKLLATRATKAGVKTAVFDRGGYKFHGRVKQVAEGVTASGIKI